MTLGDWYNDEVLPAVFDRLDQAFEEFRWVRRGSLWRATVVPEGIGVGDASRIECKAKAGAPPGFVVHGGMSGNCWRWLEWVMGMPETARVQGDDFKAAVRAVAARVGMAEPEGDEGPEAAQRRRERAEAAAERRRQAEREEARKNAEQVERAAQLWKVSKPDELGMLRQYFEGRGLDLAELDELPGALRFLQYCPVPPQPDDPNPEPSCAMVANITDGRRTVGLHRTFLEKAGPGKTVKRRDLASAKAMLGRPAAFGGAVRLGELDETGRLVLCEGIETGMALAVSQPVPVWCCLSTAGLIRASLPSEVRGVLIAADLDQVNEQRGGRPGELAARELAERLFNERPGVEVRLMVPSHEVAPGLVTADGEVAA